MVRKNVKGHLNQSQLQGVFSPVGLPSPQNYKNITVHSESLSRTFLPVVSVASWSWHFWYYGSLFLVMSSLWDFFFCLITKWDCICRCVSVPRSSFLKFLNCWFLIDLLKFLFFLLSSEELLFSTFLYT